MSYGSLVDEIRILMNINYSTRNVPSASLPVQCYTSPIFVTQSAPSVGIWGKSKDLYCTRGLYCTALHWTSFPMQCSVDTVCRNGMHCRSSHNFDECCRTVQVSGVNIATVCTMGKLRHFACLSDCNCPGMSPSISDHAIIPTCRHNWIFAYPVRFPITSINGMGAMGKVKVNVPASFTSVAMAF